MILYLETRTLRRTGEEGGTPQLSCEAWPKSGVILSACACGSRCGNYAIPEGAPPAPGYSTCTQDLGLAYCPNLSWFWYAEITATVSDDASKWKAKQHAVETTSGNWKDSQGTLHPFQNSWNSGSLPGDDDPCAPNDKRPDCQGVISLQQTPGQKTIFWLDDPGSLYLYDMAKDVNDSLNLNGHFTSRVCNRFNVCTKVPWFVNIVVDPGSALDYGLSAAGLAGVGP